MLRVRLRTWRSRCGIGRVATSVRPWVLLAITLVSSCTDARSGEGRMPPAEAPECALTQPGEAEHVAKNALEAWPDRPEDVPPVRRDDLLTAAAVLSLCNALEYSAEIPPGTISWEVQWWHWHLEREIPIKSGAASERVEFIVNCVVANRADCSAVRACTTEADIGGRCEEIGCSEPSDFYTSCDGDVASVYVRSSYACIERNPRDCSRAFAQCDPSRYRGCTDRRPTLCPEPAVPDRCEGNIRLGCDGTGHVSFHNCASIEGGRCGPTSEGNFDCILADPVDSGCPSDRFQTTPTCKGGIMTACLYGKTARAEVPEVCAALAME